MNCRLFDDETRGVLVFVLAWLAQIYNWRRLRYELNVSMAMKWGHRTYCWCHFTVSWFDSTVCLNANNIRSYKDNRNLSNGHQQLQHMRDNFDGDGNTA